MSWPLGRRAEIGGGGEGGGVHRSSFTPTRKTEEGIFSHAYGVEVVLIKDTEV